MIVLWRESKDEVSTHLLGNNERDGSMKPENKSIAYLFVVFLGLVILIFIMTSLRYMSFLTMNWDLGINMQALWTNTHGFLLYETADYQTSGIRSFLQINSAYIAIPLSFIYRVFPTAFTLLLVQALVISASIFPLYFYTVKKIQNWKIALLVCLIFVLNFAVLSGVFYDFHWETFMPLLFFSFIFFFSKGRYGLALVLLIIGSLTLEVFQFMAASYLLYTLAFPRNSVNEITAKLSDRKIRTYSFILLLCAGVAYYSIAYIGEAIIPTFVGSAQVPSAPIHAIAYLFNFGTDISTLINSLGYWLLLFTSLGFVTFIRLKPMIIVLPWFYWSVIAHPVYTSQFGVQYGVLAVALLMMPFIEGIGVMYRRINESSAGEVRALYLGPAALLVLSAGFETTSLFLNHNNLLFFIATYITLGFSTFVIYRYLIRTNKGHKGKPLRVLKQRSLFLFLVLIILVSVVIGPTNYINRTPPATGGYSMSYVPSPSYQYMQNISGLIGHNSTALSTDNLFPFIANDANAFSFFWYSTNYTNNTYFPYKSSNLPEFLLIDESQMFTVPAYLKNLAFNSTSYGLRSEIKNAQYPGNIYLFEKNYKKSASIHNA